MYRVSHLSPLATVQGGSSPSAVACFGTLTAIKHRGGLIVSSNSLVLHARAPLCTHCAQNVITCRHKHGHRLSQSDFTMTQWHLSCHTELQDGTLLIWHMSKHMLVYVHSQSISHLAAVLLITLLNQEVRATAAADADGTPWHTRGRAWCQA